MPCEYCGRELPHPKMTACDSCEVTAKTAAGYQLITLAGGPAKIQVWYRDRTQQQSKDDARYSEACQRGFLDV